MFWGGAPPGLTPNIQIDFILLKLLYVAERGGEFLERRVHIDGAEASIPYLSLELRTLVTTWPCSIFVCRRRTVGRVLAKAAAEVR